MANFTTITTIFKVLGFIYSHIPVIPAVVAWLKRYNLLSSFISVGLSVAVSLGATVVFNNSYNKCNVDYTKSRARAAATRLWAENVVDNICKMDKNCKISARTFQYQTDMDSGVWCLGQRGAPRDKAHLGRKEIYIGKECQMFLEKGVPQSLDYNTLRGMCHDLVDKCLFNAKSPSNHRALIMCKRDMFVENAFSCVALVDGHEVDRYTSYLAEFLLNANLSLF